MDTSRKGFIATVCFLDHRDDVGRTTVIVAPQWGANVIGFAYQQKDWAWPIPILEAVDPATIAMKPTSYGMPILAPTPGRVGRNQSGVFTYRGRRYNVKPARHGFLRNLLWAVAEQDETSVSCVVDVNPPVVPAEGEAFPFDFRAVYDVEVGPGALSCKLRLINTGQSTQPLNVGWHPYLHSTGPCTVRIPARSRWELDGEQEPTPTGEIREVAGPDDFRDGRSLGPNEHWDDVFTDLSSEEGHVSCWLEGDAAVLAKDGKQLTYRVRRGINMDTPSGRVRPLRNVQLFTPQGRQAISLEPLSAPPNALNLLAEGHERADVCEVEPGEEVVFELTVHVRVRSL